MRFQTPLTLIGIAGTLFAVACGGSDDDTAATGAGGSSSAGKAGSASAGKAGSAGSTTAGSGGTTAGKAGSGGSTAGKAGSSGSGGSTAGKAGSSGSAGSAAGAAGKAGAAGSTAGAAGSTAAGAAGSTTAGAAGSTTAGAAGVAGSTAGAAGSTTAGAAGTATGGTGGSATGGSGGSAGSAAGNAGAAGAPETCTDGIKNQDETDIDCGGMTCSGCAVGGVCVTGTDCASTFCDGSLCVATQCEDKVKDGAETDVDCGGGTCNTCADTQNCTAGTDCTSGICNGTICVATQCEDLVTDGAETDVDCGGGTCTTCALGKGCLAASDCTSGFCNGSVCVSTECQNLTKDGLETDVDCGGGICNTCADGLACLADTDCASGACYAGTCVQPAKSCRDIHTNYPAAPDGQYTIDIDGPGGDTPVKVLCDMTTDGGGWTKILQYAFGGYTPTSLGVGDISSLTPNAFAKLSDARINAIGGGVSKQYMMRGDKTTKRTEFISNRAFNDATRYWGLIGTAGGNSLMACQAAPGNPCNLVATRETAGVSALDTVVLLAPGAANDCDRFFVDYNTPGPSCFPNPVGDRCVNSGASCGNHLPINGFNLWTRELTPMEGALASWSFDGSLADGTGHNVNMTTIGAGATLTATGHNGGGLSTTGGSYGRASFPLCYQTGNGCGAGNQPGYFIPRADHSFAFWMKKNTAGGAVGGVQVVEFNGCDRVIGETSPDGQAQYNAWSEINNKGNAVLADGNWHHVVYVLDHNMGVRVYVDGALDISVTGAAATTGNCGLGCSGFSWATNYWLGSAGNCRYGANGFDGTFDDAAIYGYALTDADAAALYAAQQ